MKQRMFCTLAAAALIAASPLMANDPGDVKGVDAGSPGSGLATTVGPDAFGYTAADETEATGPAAFGYFDISGTGTSAGLAGVDDGGSGALPIGFDFDFYGTVYTTAAMASNGYLNFNPAGDIGDFSNDCPGLNALDPDQSIYPYWDDLVVDATGDGFFETFATCPITDGGFGACTIFQWEDVRLFSDAGATLFDFQLILYDTNNFIVSMPPGNTQSGDSATIGIENETPSTIGLDYACNTTGSMPANRSVLFCYPGNTCPAIMDVGPPITDVPTLNTVGLAVLLFLLVAAAFWALRRRTT